MAEKSFYVYYCLCFAFSLQKGIINLFRYISDDVFNPHILLMVFIKNVRNLLNISLRDKRSKGKGKGKGIKARDHALGRREEGKPLFPPSRLLIKIITKITQL